MKKWRNEKNILERKKWNYIGWWAAWKSEVMLLGIVIEGEKKNARQGKSIEFAPRDFQNERKDLPLHLDLFSNAPCTDVNHALYSRKWSSLYYGSSLNFISFTSRYVTSLCLKKGWLENWKKRKKSKEKLQAHMALRNVFL